MLFDELPMSHTSLYVDASPLFDDVLHPLVPGELPDVIDDAQHELVPLAVDAEQEGVVHEVVRAQQLRVHRDRPQQLLLRRGRDVQRLLARRVEQVHVQQHQGSVRRACSYARNVALRCSTCAGYALSNKGESM